MQFHSRFRGGESAADLGLEFVPRKCNGFQTPCAAHAFNNEGDFPTRFLGWENLLIVMSDFQTILEREYCCEFGVTFAHRFRG